MVDADDIEWEVEAIRDHRLDRTGGRKQSTLYFLVCWKGFPVEAASWEPATNVRNASDLVYAYVKTLPAPQRSAIINHPQFRTAASRT